MFKGSNNFVSTRGVGRSQILVGLNHNSALTSVGLQPPFTTVILKYWWGCSLPAPPTPLSLYTHQHGVGRGKAKLSRFGVMTGTSP